MGTGMMSFGLLMMVLGLLVVAGVTAVIAWAVVRFAGGGASGNRGSARRILDERYARGEIGPEEYQRIRRELG